MTPEERIEELLLKGAIEVYGLDNDTGDFLYSFTPKVYEVDPEMAKASEKAFYDSVMFLWSYGFLSMDVLLENPVISLTEKALDPEAVDQLPREMRVALSSIMNGMKNKGHFR